MLTVIPRAFVSRSTSNTGSTRVGFRNRISPRLIAYLVPKTFTSPSFTDTTPRSAGRATLPRSRRSISACRSRVSDVWNSRLGPLSIRMSSWMLRRYSLGVVGTVTGLALDASRLPRSARGVNPARTTVTVPDTRLLADVPVRFNCAVSVVDTPSG